MSFGKLTEAKFQEQVIDLAQLFGWRCAHFRPARVMRGGKEVYETPVSADGRGFPDLLMVRRHRLVVAELKSATGVVSPDQEAWLSAFDGVTHVTTGLWRPADIAEIERTLRDQS